MSLSSTQPFSDMNKFTVNGKSMNIQSVESEKYIMKIELHNVLKRELKSRGMTINGLARECRIPVSVLHSWLQGVKPSARNLHHIYALSKCLELPLSVLLFNQDELRPETTILFNSEFADGDHKYRLSVEKVRKGG